ncbi:MAG: ATP-dependent Clp protease adaptor ClpS [Bergeyella sp.]|nr:ATP-dependent Clp protease adaptor ClpS [Bergeyella sp.]
MQSLYFFIENQESPHRELEGETDLFVNEDNDRRLVLYNDDVNTFEFVIQCLIHICHHTEEQAEQCTFLVHYKGKCTVKTGSTHLVEPMHKKLLSKGLTSEIL